MPKTVGSQQVHGNVRISHPWEQGPPGIAAQLRPSIPQTRDAVIEGIRAEVPAYARPLEGAFGAGVRIGVEQALDEMKAFHYHYLFLPHLQTYVEQFPALVAGDPRLQGGF